MFLTIMSWVLFGALVGWISSILSDDESSAIATKYVLVGIAGALLGGFVVKLVGSKIDVGFSASGLIIAIFGSLLMIAITRGFNRVS